MSKTALILIILCFVAGIAIVWFFDFNPATAMLTFIEDPMGSLETLPNTLITHWQPVATGVGGAISALALVSRTYNQKKQEAQETKNLLEGKITEASEAKAKVQGEADAYKGTVNQQAQVISAKDTEIVRLNKTILDKDAEVQRLRNDLSYGQKAEKDWVLAAIKKETRKP